MLRPFAQFCMLALSALGLISLAMPDQPAQPVGGVPRPLQDSDDAVDDGISPVAFLEDTVEARPAITRVTVGDEGPGEQAIPLNQLRASDGAVVRASRIYVTAEVPASFVTGDRLVFKLGASGERVADVEPAPVAGERVRLTIPLDDARGLRSLLIGLKRGQSDSVFSEPLRIKVASEPAPVLESVTPVGGPTYPAESVSQPLKVRADQAVLALAGVPEAADAVRTAEETFRVVGVASNAEEVRFDVRASLRGEKTLLVVAPPVSTFGDFNVDVQVRHGGEFQSIGQPLMLSFAPASSPADLEIHTPDVGPPSENQRPLASGAIVRGTTVVLRVNGVAWPVDAAFNAKDVFDLKRTRSTAPKLADVLVEARPHPDDASERFGSVDLILKLRPGTYSLSVGVRHADKQRYTTPDAAVTIAEVPRPVVAMVSVKRPAKVGESLIWADEALRDPILLPAGEVTFTVAGVADLNALTSADIHLTEQIGDELRRIEITEFEVAQRTFSFSAALTEGRHVLQVGVLHGADDSLPSDPVTLLVPRTGVVGPQIEQVTTGLFSDAQNTDSEISLIDDYLRVTGRLDPRDTARELVLFAASKSGAAPEGPNYAVGLARFPASRVIFGPRGTFEAVFTPQLPEGPYALWVAAERRSGDRVDAHAFGFPIMDVIVSRAAVPLGPGDVSLGLGADPNLGLDPVDGQFYASGRSIVVSAESAFIEGGYLLLYPDRQEEPLVIKLREDQKVYSFPPIALEPRAAPYLLRVAVAVGGDIIYAEPARVLVRRDGPAVVDVDDRAFSVDPTSSSLTVVFNPENLLDPSVADARDNYVLRNLSLSDARDLTPTSAIFDPATNSVELTFPESAKNAGTYRLLVKAARGRLEADAIDEDKQAVLPVGLSETGIKDLFGNPLGSTALVSARPFTAEIVRAVGPETVPQQIGPGLSGLTGQYVPYPEYTKFREPIDGFNPSDKVITRVVRLYYFRDAHRVAQIINRKSRSYNRQQVNQQYQLAERSRTLAEDAIANRRALERNAVRRAQEARAAEEALNSSQQALEQARAQAAPIAEADRAAEASVNDTAMRLDAARRAAVAAATPEDKSEAQAQVAAMQEQLSVHTAHRTEIAADLAAASAQVDFAERQVTAGLAAVQGARTAEVETTEAWHRAEEAEDRLIVEQFRKEVAAATADPDTYAEGDPESIDPVEQTSLSVVGTGLIQLRGPSKGVNIVHTMINQLDAPVGQVRIHIHDIQVNGEQGERMEPIVARIQRYVDHSRFLSVRSAQMLRNTIVTVASEQAAKINAECPAVTQAERDLKYMEAFFGADFIAELREMDSEFLNSGNKVLSLHSMDSTSLASALFLMALAKNEVRREILTRFLATAETQLSAEEMEYFQASGAEFKFGPALHKKDFQFFGQNARFVRLRGFFDVEVVGNDTLTPIQREFIRLAQIMKARLVTEVEFNERVLERALIEERVGDYLAELQRAKQREEMADEAVAAFRESLRAEQVKVVTASEKLAAEARRVSLQAVQARKRSADVSQAAVDSIIRELRRLPRFSSLTNDQFNSLTDTLRGGIDHLLEEVPAQDITETYVAEILLQPRRKIEEWEKSNDTPRARIESAFPIPLKGGGEATYRVGQAEGAQYVDVGYEDAPDDYLSLVRENREIADWLSRPVLSMYDYVLPPDLLELASGAQAILGDYELTAESTRDAALNRIRLAAVARRTAIVLEVVAAEAESLVDQLRTIQEHLAGADPNIPLLFGEWQSLRRQILASVQGDLAIEAAPLLVAVDEGFGLMIEAGLKRRFAEDHAAEVRRPLDYRKFLDMLVDDVEEKFIDLVDGTRAQTANIDNYIARILIALEDDLNTQFYFPAFRAIRETSQYYDVQVGAVETTNVLVSNRMYAKVSPQAVMEFDLPKRDILITEAFDAAGAVYGEYGALMADPNFLALTKLYGGQPTATVHGSPFPNPVVRDVLPGLPGEVDEQFMIQQDITAPDFESPLEALIPDPAIYKFEQGTGFELRPVIQPDGQAVNFHLQYLYQTNLREPVDADEKHLGRVKRHLIDTDVVLENYELREVSRFQVALRASRTGRGVPLLEDVPGVGVLFRPLPSDESSLQENIVLAQATIFPTLFDLNGLRWAPSVADLDTLRLREQEFVTRSRRKALRNEVFDYSSHSVDEFLRIPPGDRRPDLYRTQETIPFVHPNGYHGPGLGLRDSHLREGFDPRRTHPETPFARDASDHVAPLEPTPPEAAVPPAGMLPPDGPVFGPPAGFVIPPGGVVPVPGGPLPGSPAGASTTTVHQPPVPEAASSGKAAPQSPPDRNPKQHDGVTSGTTSITPTGPAAGPPKGGSGIGMRGPRGGEARGTEGPAASPDAAARRSSPIQQMSYERPAAGRVRMSLQDGLDPGSAAPSRGAPGTPEKAAPPRRLGLGSFFGARRHADR